MRDRIAASDEELAERTRAGDSEAFAELWQRHAAAGRSAARHFRSIADPDDIVSEAYLQLLRAFQRGGGPREAFRPYLYRTIRNVALNWRTRTPTVQIDDLAEVADPGAEVEDATIQKTITVRAFRTLPERWQTVLWYTEVEGMEPAEAAPYLGLSANGVAALAYRAREGFKKAWLQAHVNDLRVAPECQWATERMGDYSRGGLTPRARLRFEEHLRTCTRCPILLEEIDALGGKLAVVLLPLTLGGTAGAAMLGQRAQHQTPAPQAVARIGLRAGIAVTTTAVVLAAGAAVAVPLVLQSPEPVPPVAQTPQDPPVEPPVQRPDPPGKTPPTPDPAPPIPPPAPPRPPAPTPPVAPPVPPADTSAPDAPVIAAPAPGTLTNVAAVALSGSGEPGARVDIHDAGGALLASAAVGADGTWSVTTPTLPEGANTLRCSQVDAAGNRSTPVTVALTVDTIALPPTLDALPPDAGLYLPVLTGAAEPGAAIELLGQSTVVASAVADGEGRWSLQLPDPGSDGHEFTARQTDPAGNVSASSVSTGALSFERPTVSSPAEGGIVPSNGGATTVEVELTGIEGLRVQILVDGVATGNIHTLLAVPIVRVTAPLADGEHTIAVRYVDPESGRSGALSTRTFQIAP